MIYIKLIISYLYRIVKRRWKPVVIYTSAIFFSFVLFYKWINPGITSFMIIRWVQQIVTERKIKLHQTWVPIEDISKNMLYAAMAGEDQKFVRHIWFDLESIGNAIQKNIDKQSIVFWWSTITQQTAKNIFLWWWRSFIRKIIESYITLIMELLWSKERILEVYLNVIEFGDGIYGVKEAAKYYFNTTPRALTRYQSSLLIAILPNPRYYQHHLYGYWMSHRIQSIDSWISKLQANKKIRSFIQNTRE